MMILLNLFDGGEALVETANINAVVKDNEAGCLQFILNNQDRLRIRATMAEMKTMLIEPDDEP